MTKKLQDYSLNEYYLVLSIHGVNKMKSQLFIFMNIFMNKPIVKALGKRRPSPRWDRSSSGRHHWPVARQPWQSVGLAGKGGWRERDRAERVQTWLHHPVEVAYSLQHGRLPGRRQVVRDSLSNAARHPVELILQTCGTSLGGAELVQVLRKSAPPGGE